MIATNCTLVIMPKAPKPGTVKARLAVNLSLERLPGYTECLLRDTITLASRLDSIEVASRA
jgi:hypothetical protein